MNIDDQLLTVRGAAELLSLSIKHVYRLIGQGRIPYIRKNGVGYRFFQKDLIRWIETGRHDAGEWDDVLR